MKVDIWEVVDAAKTKPYGFMPFYPGPGLGGHCIPIDPFYLTWKAKEYNFHTRIIDVAGQINQSMPNYVVNKVGKILNEHSKCYANSNIVLLGVAYKRDIDDYRESPVIQIYESLVGLGAKVSVIDPHVPEFRSDHTGNKYKTVQFSNDLLRNADIVVLTTDHKTFDRTAIMENSKLIFDTRNFMGQKSSKIYSL
jgi:UDP-N-acetyl-D-glucosamine dehydrogenase